MQITLKDRDAEGIGRHELIERNIAKGTALVEEDNRESGIKKEIVVGAFYGANGKFELVALWRF